MDQLWGFLDQLFLNVNLAIHKSYKNVQAYDPMNDPTSEIYPKEKIC